MLTELTTNAFPQHDTATLRLIARKIMATIMNPDEAFDGPQTDAEFERLFDQHDAIMAEIIRRQAR